MFIVNDGKITNEKVITTGLFNNKADFVFQFDGQTFAANDAFALTVGTISSENYGFSADGEITFARVDLSEVIEAEETEVEIKVKKNGENILEDTIIIYASNVSGGGNPNGDKIVALSSVENIDPKQGIVYQYTLAANDVITLDTPKSGFAPVVQLWLTQPATAVTFSFGTNITWLQGLLPAMSSGNYLYAVVLRWDGSNWLGKLDFSVAVRSQDDSSSSQDSSDSSEAPAADYVVSGAPNNDYNGNYFEQGIDPVSNRAYYKNANNKYIYTFYPAMPPDETWAFGDSIDGTSVVYQQAREVYPRAATPDLVATWWNDNYETVNITVIKG